MEKSRPIVQPLHALVHIWHAGDGRQARKLVIDYKAKIKLYEVLIKVIAQKTPPQDVSVQNCTQLR